MKCHVRPATSNDAAAINRIVIAVLGYQKIREEFHGTERTIVMEKRLQE